MRRAAGTDSTATWSYPGGTALSPSSTTGTPARQSAISWASSDSGEKIMPSMRRALTPDITILSASGSAPVMSSSATYPSRSASAQIFEVSSAK